jgi:hypothetical protein
MNRVRRVVSYLRKKVSQVVPLIFEQGLFFGGIGAISFGAWMIYKPLGPIVGGAFGVWVSFLIAAERK